MANTSGPTWVDWFMDVLAHPDDNPVERIERVDPAWWRNRTSRENDRVPTFDWKPREPTRAEDLGHGRRDA
jgi:hypothetical protein